MTRRPARAKRSGGKSARRTQSTAAGSTSGRDQRQRIVDAFMALLADKPIERIGFKDIASHAGVPLADARGMFDSKIAILAAHMREIDRLVLGGGDSDLAEEPARERLFDILMRRLEALEPHKAAVRSLLRSGSCNPGLALALNRLATRSMQWMLTAADIGASGPKGAIRAQGLSVLYANVLRTWLDDDDSGLARTMAALDQALARGQQFAGLLDDLFSIPTYLCRARRHWRRHGDSEEKATA